MSRDIIGKAKQVFWTNKIKLSDQFGLIEQVTAPDLPLPEFLFIGSTNVGKSSLLTQLLNPPRRQNKAPTNELPRVSKRAGFTATMSVYTVGKLLRLIDSPGYGHRSTNTQGDVVTQYLEIRASEIRNAYVLIHPKRGVSEMDTQACAILAKYGVPFNFVLTKTDLKPIEELSDAVNSVYRDLGVPGGDLFRTSVKRNEGVDELRQNLIESSGIFTNYIKES